MAPRAIPAVCADFIIHFRRCPVFTATPDAAAAIISFGGRAPDRQDKQYAEKQK
jgi:hypothetical protein